MSPWRTSTLISKKLVSPLEDLTKYLVSLYSIIMTAIVSEGMSYARKIFSISPLYTQLKALQKPAKSKAVCRFFALTATIIHFSKAIFIFFGMSSQLQVEFCMQPSLRLSMNYQLNVELHIWSRISSKS